MRRREVTAALTGAALGSASSGGRTQQSGRVYRVGMLETVSAELNAANLIAFREGLRDHGYIEGRNLTVEYKSADGDGLRFPALVSELIGLNLDVIVTRGTPASLAAKNATSTIPIVIAGITEPLLVVEGLARPGGNITGFSGVQADLDAKWIELVLELAPGRAGIATLLNMSNPGSGRQLKELQGAAQEKGLRFRMLDVRNAADVERAFSVLIGSSEAVVIQLEAVTQANRHLIVALAAKHMVPVIYGGREFVEAGGLMFYGPSVPAANPDRTRPEP